MAVARAGQPRAVEEVAFQWIAAGLLLLNAVFLASFRFLCPLAVAAELITGEGFYNACAMSLSFPLFPLTLLLAALDGAMAVTLVLAKRWTRQWILLRAALGALAWGILTLVVGGNLFPLIQFAVSLLFLLLLGGLLLRLIFPSAFWLTVFFSAPLVIVLIYSFLQKGTYGGVEWNFNLENYGRFFDPLYLAIFGRSFRIAAITTLLCFIFGYPLAYFIARRPPRWRNFLILLLMVPFWTNFVVRTYAWKLILSNEGFLNTFWSGPLNGMFLWLQQNVGDIFAPLVDLTADPIPLLYTETAIVIGLVYGWMTEMILPCYAAIERIDFSLVEAAKDLYANDVRAFVRVILPLTMPGIVAGSILVFIPSLGAYVTPDMLGGAKTMMIGNLIQSQFLGTARDWPFGSAISFVLMAIMLVGTLIYFRVGARTA